MKGVSLEIFKNEELLGIAICSFLVLICLYLIYRKYKNKELFYLGSIVVIYGIISIWNLGSFEMPISTWQPTTDNQSFILELSQSEFEQINIIYGEGDNNSLVGEYEYQLGVDGIIIEGSNDLSNWDNIVTLDEGPIYEYQSIKGCFNYKYIRINSSSKLNTITELVFYNDEKIIDCRVYEDDYKDSKYPAFLVIDEQEMIEIDPIYYDEFFFDEVYHVRNAKEIADGQYMYANTHPLLGTNIIALFIKLFGFSPFVYRLPGVIFGVLIVIAVYYICKKLFDDIYLSCVGAILCAGDFMHLTTSRIGTLEPFSILFIIMMYYFMVKYYKEDNYKKELINLLLSGIFMGFAISVKWNACYSAVGLAFILFRKLLEKKERVIKTLLWCLLFFVLNPLLIYCLCYLPDKVWKDDVWSFKNVFEHNLMMFKYHHELNASHPFEARWYEWLLDLRPIWYYANINDNVSNTIACFSNPLLTWFGLPCVVYTLFNIKDKRAFVIIMGYVSSLLPWIFISRSTFAYHFYPTSIFTMLAIVYTFSKLENRKVINTFIFIYLLVFIVYLPICTGFGTTREYIKLLEVLPRWYFG